MFDNILIKTPEQIEGIRAACRDAALVLDYIEPFVKVGVTTEYLDDLMLRYTTRTAPILIRKLPAFPSIIRSATVFQMRKCSKTAIS